MPRKLKLKESKCREVYELFPADPKALAGRGKIKCIINWKWLEEEAKKKKISTATVSKCLKRLVEEGFVNKEMISWKNVQYSRSDTIEMMVEKYNYQTSEENLTWFLLDKWNEIIRQLAQVAENYNKKKTDYQAQKYFETELDIRIIPMLRNHMRIFNPNNNVSEEGLSPKISEAYRKASIALENLSMDIARAETGFVHDAGPDRYDRKYDPERKIWIRTLKGDKQ